MTNIAKPIIKQIKDNREALDYFEKAIETLPEDANYRLRSKIYSQLVTLFLY